MKKCFSYKFHLFCKNGIIEVFNFFCFDVKEKIFIKKIIIIQFPLKFFEIAPNFFRFFFNRKSNCVIKQSLSQKCFLQNQTTSRTRTKENTLSKKEGKKTMLRMRDTRSGKNSSKCARPEKNFVQDAQKDFFQKVGCSTNDLTMSTNSVKEQKNPLTTNTKKKIRSRSQNTYTQIAGKRYSRTLKIMATQKAFEPQMTTDKNEEDMNVYTHLSKLINSGETG